MEVSLYEAHDTWEIRDQAVNVHNVVGLRKCRTSCLKNFWKNVKNIPKEIAWEFFENFTWEMTDEKSIGVP